MDDDKTVGDYFTLDPKKRTVKGGVLLTNIFIVTANFKSLEEIRISNNYRSVLSDLDSAHSLEHRSKDTAFFQGFLER